MKRDLEIMVSDPWEFGTEHGVGPFRCQLCEVSPRGSAYAKLVKPIVISGVSCQYVKIRPRLTIDSIEKLLAGMEISANFIFGKDEASVKEPWDSSMAPFAGIGSARPVS